MKRFRKILAAVIFFSFGAAFPVYAAETNDSLLKALGFPSRAESIASKNLQTALAQESKDQAQYLAFADKADEEGQPENGKVFRALARAKQSLLDYMGKSLKTVRDNPEVATEAPIVKNTAENLKSAMDSELYKSTEMYPGFLAQNPSDIPKEVADVFKLAQRIDASHAGLLQEILATDPAKIPVSAYNICTACGYVFLEWAEVDTCPICGASKEKLKNIVKE
ncbi:MAG: ferritin family protein [Candidatus Omnitrophota bacterium]